MGYGYGGPPQHQGYGMQVHPGYPMQAWTCRVCQFVGQAMLKEKVSTGGWIVFALLLLICLPLFWIGLLMKEKTAVCPRCGANA